MYCEKCNLLSKEENCPNCGGRLRKPEESDPVCCSLFWRMEEFLIPKRDKWVRRLR